MNSKKPTSWNDQQGWMEALRDQSADVRQLALARLVECPEQSSVDELQRCLGDSDENVRHLSVAAMGILGTPAVAGLTEALSTESAIETRIAAAASLARLGPDAKPAIPSLRECMDDNDGNLRWHAAWALSQIGIDSLAALTDASESDSRLVQIAAVEAFGWIGAPASEIAPRLAERMDSDDPDLRLACVAAHIKIKGDPGTELEELTEALCDGPACILALDKIGELGDLGQPAIPNLQRCLREGNTEERCHAALALARVKANDQKTIHELTAALNDADAEVRCRAAAAVASLGAAATDALPALQEMQNDTDPQVAAAAKAATDIVVNSSP